MVYLVLGGQDEQAALSIQHGKVNIYMRGYGYYKSEQEGRVNNVHKEQSSDCKYQVRWRKLWWALYVPTVNICTLGPTKGFAVPLCSTSGNLCHSFEAEVVGSLTYLCPCQQHILTQNFTCSLQHPKCWKYYFYFFFSILSIRKASHAEFNLSVLIHLKLWKGSIWGTKAIINNCVINIKTITVATSK